MNRAEKIKLLTDLQAGRADITQLDELPPVIVIMPENGKITVVGIPASWGFCMPTDANGLAAIKTRLNDYCGMRQRQGLSLPIIVHFPEEKTYPA